MLAPLPIVIKETKRKVKINDLPKPKCYEKKLSFVVF